MSIRAVIFDLDHTLYNFMDCHEIAYIAVADYAKEHFGIDRESYIRQVTEAMHQTNEKVGKNSAATHSRTLRYQTFLENIGEDAITHAYPMNRVYWDTFYKVMKPEPVVEKVLSAIKDKGLTILIATDMTSEIQFEKIRVLGIGRYIDFLVTSEEAGAEKPDDRILNLCLKKAKAKARECVFVGDHPKKDVLGPQAFGMNAVWCRHFDVGRFLREFGKEPDKDVQDQIIHRIERYEDCLRENDVIDLGGIVL